MMGTGSVARGSSSSSKLPKYSSTTSRGSLDRSKLPWFMTLLVAVKMGSSLATFMLSDFLHSVSNKGGDGDFRRLSKDEENGLPSFTASRGFLGSWGPLLQTLGFIQLSAGVTYVLVQKPFRKSPIPPLMWFRIFRHAAISLGFLLAWCYGLMLSGPLRTIFLSCHYDFTLASIVTGLFVSKSGARLRGSVLFIFGIIILLVFGDSSELPTKHHRPTRSTEVLEEQYFLSKNSVGVMTLIFCLVYKLFFDALAKSLSVDIGGSKRLHTLSTATSGVLLLLLNVADLMTGGTLIPIWSGFIMLIFVVVFGFVLNYYIDTICLKRMEPHQVARIGSSATHFSALLYSLIWISSEVPTVPTLLSFALVYTGMLSLTTSERASGGGSLIGYSSDGLPLFNFSSQLSSEHDSFWRNVLRLGVAFYRQVQEDRMSRKIFYYFLLTMVFTAVELLYGVITNSLGLITDGFHMLFDATAICIGLCASVMCRWQPSRTFPFGYGRLEVLSGFLNALFLLVVAAVIFMEAWVRLFDPPTVDAHRLLPISIIGLIVNLIGIYAFRNGTGLDHSHVHDNANVRGVFLHVLADTLGSIGVIISSVLIKHYGIFIADPICSLVIASLIVISALPLLKDTARVLLLTIPVGLERNIQQAIMQILAMEGVKGYKKPRFWTHAPNILTGSIHIQATQDAHEQQVIRLVNSLFSSIGFNHFTTQVEKDDFISSRNSNYDDEEDADSMYGRSNTLREPSFVGIASSDYSPKDASGGTNVPVPNEVNVQ